MGPIQSMFAQMIRDPEMRLILEQRMREEPGALGADSAFNQRRGLGPRAFRDPQQAGPSPGPVQSMFGSPTVRGNIDVMHRPQAMNPDGSISTVRSLGVNIGGNEVLIPTVSEDARVMSDDEAIRQYERTGRHLGMFDSPESSTAYANRLHNQQEALGEARALSSGDMGPAARRARRLTSQRKSDGPIASLFRGAR